MGVGAYSFMNFSGRAYIFKGRADFYSYYSNYTPLFTDIIETGTLGDKFGACVSGAGDFNGDGKADYLVGVPYKDIGISTDAGVWYTLLL
ncbi:MAG: hypothetical protein IPL53_14315 [Ignavibacteria bacterium]|nr:hypothetical protein [Ignavibacteria bacterium]